MNKNKNKKKKKKNNNKKEDKILMNNIIILLFHITFYINAININIKLKTIINIIFYTKSYTSVKSVYSITTTYQTIKCPKSQPKL
jgi:hypothetical protein